MKDETEEQKSKKILVIAPRFPSINQPWIDTYLEQLLKKKFSLAIYSSVSEPSVYQDKVDTLRLREMVLPFSIDKNVLLATLYRQPLELLRHTKSWSRILATVQESKSQYGIRRTESITKLLYFCANKSLFSNIDVIHAHEEIAGFHFVYLAKLLKIPLVVTFHGLPPSGVGQLAPNKRRWMYNYAKTVIVNTNFAKQQVIQLGCPEEKVNILPQGLSTEGFPFFPNPFPATSQPVVLLTVGRFHRDKGHRYAIVAAKRLTDQGLNIEYHIAGVGPEKQRLEKLTEKLHITNRVTFHEAISAAELRGLYKKAHIFVLPSIFNLKSDHVETQGVVLQEAQASGCIPVATNIGGIPECLSDGINAILVGDKSSREITKGILKLTARRDSWKNFQDEGLVNVENNFSAEIIGEKMATLLKEAAI